MSYSSCLPLKLAGVAGSAAAPGTSRAVPGAGCGPRGARGARGARGLAAGADRPKPGDAQDAAHLSEA